MRGDIGAITKLASTRTGDTLCAPGRIFKAPAPVFPVPTYSMALKVKQKGDEGKISGALTRLMEEDCTLSYKMNTETLQQVISGLGEQHLDAVVSKLKSKFGVEVELTVPRIPYRESLRKKVKKQGRHKKQSGGHGQFGDVWIEFEPTDSEELVFEEKVFGGAVPKNFFPAVEKGPAGGSRSRRAGRLSDGWAESHAGRTVPTTRSIPMSSLSAWRQSWPIRRQCRKPAPFCWSRLAPCRRLCPTAIPAM